MPGHGDGWWGRRKQCAWWAVRTVWAMMWPLFVCARATMWPWSKGKMAKAISYEVTVVVVVVEVVLFVKWEQINTFLFKTPSRQLLSILLQLLHWMTSDIKLTDYTISYPSHTIPLFLRNFMATYNVIYRCDLDNLRYPTTQFISSLINFNIAINLAHENPRSKDSYRPAHKKEGQAKQGPVWMKQKMKRYKKLRHNNISNINNRCIV